MHSVQMHREQRSFQRGEQEPGSDILSTPDSESESSSVSPEDLMLREMERLELGDAGSEGESKSRTRGARQQPMDNSTEACVRDALALIPLVQDGSIRKHSLSSGENSSTKPTTGEDVFFNLQIRSGRHDDLIFDSLSCNRRTPLCHTIGALPSTPDNISACDRNKTPKSQDPHHALDLMLANMARRESAVFLLRGGHWMEQVFNLSFMDGCATVGPILPKRLKVYMEMVNFGLEDILGDRSVLFRCIRPGQGSEKPNPWDMVTLSVDPLNGPAAPAAAIQLGIGALPLGIEVAVSKRLQRGSKGSLILRGKYRYPGDCEDLCECTAGLRNPLVQRPFCADEPVTESHYEVELFGFEKFINCSAHEGLPQTNSLNSLSGAHAKVLIRSLDLPLHPTDCINEGDTVSLQISHLPHSIFANNGVLQPLAPQTQTFEVSVGAGGTCLGLDLALNRLSVNVTYDLEIEADYLLVLRPEPLSSEFFSQKTSGSRSFRMRAEKITFKHTDRNHTLRLIQAEDRKIQGNELFKLALSKAEEAKSELFAQALAKYRRGYSMVELMKADDWKDLTSDGATLEKDIERHQLSLQLNSVAALLKLGRAAEALPISHNACELAPKDAKALYRRGGVFFELEQYEEAERDLSKALILNPKDAKLANLLKKARRLRQEFDKKAKPLYSKMLGQS